MSFRNVRDRIPAQPLVESGLMTFDIPRGFLLRNLGIRIAGTYTTTGGTPALPDAVDSPFELIQRVEIIADGRDTIKSVTGAQLARLNHYYNGIVPPFAVGTGVGAGQAFNFMLMLPFELPLAIKPIDTLLDTRRHETIQLVLTTGAIDGTVITGSTISAETATVTVVPFATTEPSDALFSQHRTFFIRRDVVTTSTSLDIDIPVQNIIRSILIRAEEDGDASDAPMNAVSIIADNAFMPVNTVPWTSLQDISGVDFRIVSPAGYALIEFAEDGRMGAALQTADLANLKARLDVTAGTNTRVELAVTEIVPADIAELAALA